MCLQIYSCKNSPGSVFLVVIFILIKWIICQSVCHQIPWTTNTISAVLTLDEDLMQCHPKGLDLYLHLYNTHQNCTLCMMAVGISYFNCCLLSLTDLLRVEWQDQYCSHIWTQNQAMPLNHFQVAPYMATYNYI